MPCATASVHPGLAPPQVVATGGRGARSNRRKCLLERHALATRFPSSHRDAPPPVGCGVEIVVGVNKPEHCRLVMAMG